MQQLPLAVRRYTSLVRNAGIDPQTILYGSDIKLSHLDDPDYAVEPGQCRIVVENMIRHSANRGIGLDAGMNTALPKLGAVGHVLLTCRTIGEAYEPWRRFGEPLAGIVGKFKLTDEDCGSLTFCFDCDDVPRPLLTFYIEELLGMVNVVGQALVGEPVRISRASFDYPEPDYSDRYRTLLDCPLRFNAPTTSITLERRWVDHALQVGDQGFNRLCLQNCEETLQRLSGTSTVSASLRSLFHKSRMDAIPTLDMAAAALAMSSRTLRRRLDQEGTSFQKQLTLFRAERARSLIRHGIPTKLIADRLGYADASAFRSAFKEWTGQTVGDYKHMLANLHQ